MKKLVYRKLIMAITLCLLLTVSSKISSGYAAEAGTIESSENSDTNEAVTEEVPAAETDQTEAGQDTLSDDSSAQSGQDNAGNDNSDQPLTDNEQAEDAESGSTDQDSLPEQETSGDNKETTELMNRVSSTVDNLQIKLSDLEKRFDALELKLGKLEKKDSTLFLLLIISASVLLLIGIGLVVLNIILLKKHEESLSQLEDLNEYSVQSNKSTDFYNLKLSLEALKTDMKSLNKSVSEITQSFNVAYTDEQKLNSGYSPKENTVKENQFGSDIKAAKPMSKSETFLDKYNKYLSGEIVWNDFQMDYKVEDEIQFDIDFENNRSTKLVSVGSRGHIQVFNKSYVDGQNSIALLKKNEFPAFSNNQVLNMIYSIFEIQGSTDFTKGTVTCIQPAQVQKSQGTYKVVKKGIYSIQ